MVRRKGRQTGFGAIGVIVLVLVLVAIAAISVLVYQRYRTTSKPTGAINSSQAANQQKNKTTPQPDPYKGWKTYCDSTVKACIKYPSDWVASQYGGLENPACTEYVSLTGPTSKDGGEGSAYIASIDNFSTPLSDLKILGMVINGYPTYSVYNATYISENNIQVGTTQTVAYINHRFTGKTGDAGLVGTPCAKGSEKITTSNQARAWFDSSEGKAVLKVVQSLYYQ